MSLPFRDRHDAGRQLADRLHCHAGPCTVVAGIAGGGVPVAYQIAHALHAPLDVFLVRPLSLPGQRDAAFGVVGSGGVRVLNHAAIATAGITDADIAEATDRERLSLVARERTYRRQQADLDLADRVVIIADDGTATESRLLDVIAAVRAHEPRAVVLAVPVLDPGAGERIRPLVDDLAVIVAARPDVPQDRWYRELLPVSHTEVRALLALAEAEAQSRELAGALAM